MERRLAAILASDVVAYSRLMGADEEGTVATLKKYRDCFDNLVRQRGGRVFSAVGDCTMAEFSSPVEAVRCAVDFQMELKTRNEAIPRDRRMYFRVGVNLGDVAAEGDDLVGDGVNIAARLEALAPVGGICISKTIADQIAGKVDAVFVNIGDHDLKNIVTPVEVWAWPPAEATKLRRPPGRRAWITGLSALAAAGAAAAYLTFGSSSAPDLPSGARVALIPFKNVGANPDDAFFSEGLTRDVNALLAKFSNLFVLAPQAGEVFRDDPDCATIRKELDADYILTGTVRRAANKLRVTTAFVDAKTCLQLQAPGPFNRDLDLDSVLDVQLEIARKIASLVGSSDAPLFKTEVLDLIRDKAPGTLDAYECYMTAHWFYQTFALPFSSMIICPSSL